MGRGGNEQHGGGGSGDVEHKTQGCVFVFNVKGGMMVASNMKNAS